MSEATTKASLKKKKQKITALNEEIIGGGNSLRNSVSNNPIEEYNIDTDIDTLKKL